MTDQKKIDEARKLFEEQEIAQGRSVEMTSCGEYLDGVVFFGWLNELDRIDAEYAQAQKDDPVQPARAQDDLRSRCAEILEWQNTGVLPGDALRAFAASQPYAADRNRLQMAEADTARQAYRFVVRSGQAKPAPAQDEREAFEAWAGKRGFSLVKYEGGMYVSDCTMWANIAWQERATRPTQTEQQPVAHRLINAEGEVMTDWHDGAPPDNFIDLCGVAMAGTRVELAFAAPIAQTAPQPEQSGLVNDEDAAFLDWANREYRIDGNTEELNNKHRDVVENRKGWMARAALSAQGASK